MSSSTDLSLPNNFEDAERFQRLFVLPVTTAMEVKIKQTLKPVLETVAGLRDHLNAQDTQIAKLVKDQKKALLGWSAYATAASAVLAWGWNYVRSHIKVG